MRWLLVALLATSVLSPACDCNHHHNPGTADGSGDTCTPACTGDQYCDVANNECLPWGVGPGGVSDPTCKRDPVPGVFFPGAQCEWLGPPPGDPFPNHVNVLATPMVATFYSQGEFSSPSIVFTSYNFTD